MTRHRAVPQKLNTLLKRVTPSRRNAADVALIIGGSLILAYGVTAILIPYQFISGGALGVALILHYLIPAGDISLLYILVNIPLVFLGWFKVGHRFMYYTIFGVITFAVITRLIHPKPMIIDNMILAAILGGIICGTGLGIVLRSAGSLGGTDILAIYINKRWDVRLGWTYLAFNSLILIAAAGIFSVDAALYMLIYTFTAGKVIDTIIAGFNQRKQIFIISEHAEELSDKILKRLGRGVTFLHGRGAYTNKQKNVIISIVTMTEVGRLKDVIFETDPDAFVIINDTLEVLGKRHGSKKIY